MKYQREPVTNALIHDLIPLLNLHYKEISANQDIPLSPEFENYKKIDESGMLRVFTARNESGLVGYCIFFVNRNSHYSTSLQAVQDVLFVHPDHRGSGAKLILFCDNELKKEGVQVVYHHIKVEHDHPSMMARLGYKFVDKIYSKRLD